MDEEVGSSPAMCYQFELKITGYSIEFSVAVPKANCDVMQTLVEPKTLKTDLDGKKLAVPFPVILCNSRSDGYAILEQLNLSYVSK